MNHQSMGPPPWAYIHRRSLSNLLWTLYLLSIALTAAGITRTAIDVSYVYANDYEISDLDDPYNELELPILTAGIVFLILSIGLHVWLVRNHAYSPAWRSERTQDGAMEEVGGKYMNYHPAAPGIGGNGFQGGGGGGGGGGGVPVELRQSYAQGGYAYQEPLGRGQMPQPQRGYSAWKSTPVETTTAYN